MINTKAKEIVANMIKDSMTDGSLGTSSQPPSESDLDLVEEVTGTIKAVTVKRTGKQLVTTYNLNSVEGNDETYTEYGNKFADDDLLNRITFTGVPKSSALEFQVRSVININ